MGFGFERIETPKPWIPSNASYAAFFFCDNCNVWRTNTFYGAALSLALDKAYKDVQRRYEK